MARHFKVTEHGAQAAAPASAKPRTADAPGAAVPPRPVRSTYLDAHAADGAASRNLPHKKTANRLLGVLCAVLFIAGAAALLYPLVSNWLADRQHEQAIAGNTAAVESTSQDELDAAWAAAEQYNESLIGQPVHDPFVPGSGYAVPGNYNEVLNLDGDGVMGSIEISKIGVNLPIYHGTSDESLARGVGHIESTALPIGGASTHAVLTGHRGLPQAELFTRLDELNVGDTFVITVLGRKLAYKVYGIDTVLPDELDSLAVQDGRDLVTLVTCTPYGVNTHRLLVHAERTEYTPSMEKAVDQGFHLSTDTLMRLAGAGLGLAILVVLALISRSRRRR